MENTEEFDVKPLISDGQNKGSVRCTLCNSLILNPGMGEYRSEETALPNMRKRKDAECEEEEEPLSDFWFVRNVYTFENVGISKAKEGKKYLTCADCEIGPIGWCTLANDDCYVAIKRVKNIVSS
nr:PREDICTED: guanine nucleotide exchange factor MSS4 homolog [Bemisia tabaci]